MRCLHTQLMPFYQDSVVQVILSQKGFHMIHVFNLPVGQQGVRQRALGWAAARTDLLTQS